MLPLYRSYIPPKSPPVRLQSCIDKCEPNTALKSDIFAKFLCEKKYNLDSLDSLQGQVINLDGENLMVTLAQETVEYQGSRYVAVDITLNEPNLFNSQDKIQSKTTVILECNNPNALQRISRDLASEVMQQFVAHKSVYLPADYSGTKQLVSYTGVNTFHHLNQFLRNNDHIIKNAATLNEFHMSMMGARPAGDKRSQQLDYAAVAATYEQYHGALIKDAESEESANFGKLYFTQLSGLIQRSFMSDRHQNTVQTAYRGVAKVHLCKLFPDNIQTAAGVPIIAVGDKMADPAFCSASINIDSARTFGGKDSLTKQVRSNDEFVVFQMEVDKQNTPFSLDLRNISQFKSEGEILFAPDSVFTVTRIDEASTTSPMMIVGTVSKPGTINTPRSNLTPMMQTGQSFPSSRLATLKRAQAQAQAGLTNQQTHQVDRFKETETSHGSHATHSSNVDRFAETEASHGLSDHLHDRFKETVGVNSTFTTNTPTMLATSAKPTAGNASTTSARQTQTQQTVAGSVYAKSRGFVR